MEILIFLIPAAILGFLLFSPIIILVKTKKYFQKKGYPKVRYITSLLIILYILFIGHSVYTGIYPDEDFYVNEFERELKMDFPNSGKIIEKDADYPDIHGDYASYFIAELSEQDYNRVLQVVDTSTGFIRQDSIYSWDMGYQADNKVEVEKEKIMFSYTHEYSDDRTNIDFCKDGKTILFACHKL